MSKSATEQYQIKKKRKHNQNHDSNNNTNNHNNRNNNKKHNNQNNNKKNRIQNKNRSFKKRQRSASTQRFNENSCFDFRVCFQNCIRDQAQTNTNKLESNDNDSNNNINSFSSNGNGRGAVVHAKGKEQSRQQTAVLSTEQKTQQPQQPQQQPQQQQLVAEEEEEEKQNENKNKSKKRRIHTKEEEKEVQVENMPLSQGFYNKTALATKRGSKAALKVVEAKRKATSEHFYNNNNNNNNSNCHNYYNHAMQTTTATGGCGNCGGISGGVGASGGGGVGVSVVGMTTGAYRRYGSLVAASTTTTTTTTETFSALLTPMSATQHLHLQQQQQQQNQQQHNYHNYHHHYHQQQHQQYQPQQQQAQNSLQLLYLIGESFAHCGCLPKAFDVYELIASRQQDGFIPLDKLSALTDALIKHLRQLGGFETEGCALSNIDASILPMPAVTTMATIPPTITTTTTTTKRQDYAIESTVKARYSAQHEHALAWQAAKCVAGPGDGALSQTVDEAQDVHLLDLHAPTRELSVSPTASHTSLPSPSLSSPSLTVAATLGAASDDFDPLLCPLCRDILRSPVTTNCGHTFCRQCCETITMCNICHIKFPRVLTAPTAAEPGMGDASSAAVAAATSVGAGASTRFYNGYTSNLIEGVNFNNNNHNNSNLATANAMPTTVTTTTVASTTSTATTTMASSSSASLAATSSSSSLSSSSMASASASLTLSMSASSAANSIVVGNNSNSNSNSSNNILISGCNNMVGARSPDNMKFMPDVLVRSLVEKWWGAELQAKKINETAASYMHLNLLDDALKFCNASLEKSPSNFKSLCLRAEVLLKLSHYQSSLADVENALKTRCISAKAHYLRALALSGLGRLDEALYDGFLAICLDRTTNLSSSEIFQHDLAKILQRLLAQTPKCKPPDLLRHGFVSKSTPYGGYELWEQRMRHKKYTRADALSAYVDVDCDVDVDEDGDFVAAYEKSCCDYITSDAEEAEASLFANAFDFMDKRDVFELRSAQEYELEARRHATRKHCRRKWTSVRLIEPETEMELEPLEDVVQRSRCRCSQLLLNIIERTHNELQRLRKLELPGAGVVSAPPVPMPQIDASDFECVVCSRTLWKPVVTPCGHTYCLVCLDRCMDYKSPCPLCMSPLVELNVNNNNMYQGSSSPVPFALAKRPVTKFLEAAMKRFIPEIYETRFRQEIDMEPSVPVLICTTAFPCVPCPLSVSDPRYRLMVRRAVESGEKTFGIVEPYNDKSRYADFGTILDIRDCVLLGDGCFILSTIGCKRFKILARSEKDGYETANVEYICDEPIADDKVKFVVDMHALVLAKAAEWLESFSMEQKLEIMQWVGDMPPLEDNWELLADGPAWAWWIIALLPLPTQLKINILAETSLEKRLRAIEKMLDRMNLNYRNRAQQHQQQQLQQQQTQQHALIDCDDDDDIDVDVDADADVDDVDVGVDVDVDVNENDNDDERHVAGADVVAVATLAGNSEDSVDECCLRTNGVGVGATAGGEQLLL